MKYLFLLVGLICGIFWSQIYAEYARFSNDYFFPQQSTAAKTPAPPPARVKSITTPQIEPVKKVAVVENKQVIMYATSWCGYCKAARKYFKDNRISFIEYDIEKDERAKRMHELLGGGGVPIIVYNGKKLRGFSQSKFVALYR